jgi:polar amino acid transport system substrate-binding protein
MSTYQNWQHNKGTTRALLVPFQKESWAIGIRKGNDALRGKVNAFLKEFRAKGGFDRLGDKYLQEQKEAFKLLGYPFYL